MTPFAKPAFQDASTAALLGALKHQCRAGASIWLTSNLDHQVIPVWMVAITPLAVSKPHFGFAYLWHAQCTHDGIIELLGSANVSHCDGNVVKNVPILQDVINECADRSVA